MELSKFFWLSRRYHVIDNPTSEQKIDAVIEKLRVAPASSVLDIGSGKGEMLCRIASKYGAQCVGVERRQRFCDEANAKAVERAVSDLITIHCMNGQDFVAADASFHVTMCIGASWIFGGFEATLAQLSRWTKSGGQVLTGDIFWASQPNDEYLRATGLAKDGVSTHSGNVEAGEALGLTLSYTAVSSPDDWDHYTGLSWQASLDYCADNPDDPDNLEIRERTVKDQAAHIKLGGRECLGWAIYVWNRP